MNMQKNLSQIHVLAYMTCKILIRRAAAKPPKKGQGEDMKKYNVIHVSTYSGKETIIRKNVSLYEANEAFYGINNTYIVEVVDE